MERNIIIEARADGYYMASMQVGNREYLIDGHKNLNKLIASLTPELLNRIALSIKWPAPDWDDGYYFAEDYWFFHDEEWAFDQEYGRLIPKPFKEPHRKPKYKDVRLKIGKV